MSDTSQGPGWWRASDGKWYPPDTHPNYRPTPPKAPPGPIPPFLPTQPGLPNQLWTGFRRWPRWGQIALVAGVALLFLFLLTRVNNDDPKQTVASDTATTVGLTTTVAPTTTVAVPAGTDTTVSAITDGDSLKIADGTAIRLTGIDSPDSGACLAAEATTHLSQLLPLGTPVRLVYDVKRTDASGRDLAYVYRLSDGLFVNVAMVRDGYSEQLTVPPNVIHADELGAAATEARAADIGVWKSCSPSTTAQTSSPQSPSATSTTRASTTTTSLR